MELQALPKRFPSWQSCLCSSQLCCFLNGSELLRKQKKNLHRNTQPWPDLFLLVFQGVCGAPVCPVGVYWVWAEGNSCPRGKKAQLAVPDLVRSKWVKLCSSFASFVRGAQAIPKVCCPWAVRRHMIVENGIIINQCHSSRFPAVPILHKSMYLWNVFFLVLNCSGFATVILVLQAMLLALWACVHSL